METYETGGRFVGLVIASLTLMATGCAQSGSPPFVDGGDPDAADAAVETRPHTDVGDPCVYDSDCDDGLFCNGLERCTNDVCAAGVAPCADSYPCTVDGCDDVASACVFTPDNAVCSNGLACDGEEQCIPGYGCITSSAPSCNDDDSCTVDTCDDAVGCVHTPRDLDGDGYVDAFCGGDDCNDLRADMNRGAVEICDDRLDNNCNRLRDFADPGCFPTNDDCASATVLPGPGTYSGGTRGTRLDYAFPCSSWGVNYDVVFAVTVPDLADVHVTMTGAGFTHTLMLQSVCGDAASNLRCETDGDLYRRSVVPGTYFILAGSDAEGEFDLTVEFLPPTPPIANDTCSAPIDVGSGGTFSGTTVTAGDDYRSSCDWGGSVDVVYQFTLAADSDVTVSVSEPTGWTTTFVSIGTRCGDSATELRCASGTPATIARRGMTPGTYYVLVQTSTETAFTLNVAISPAGVGLPGDLCSNPLAIAGSGSYPGDFTGLWDDYGASCDFGSTVDAVYTFTLTELSDVAVSAIPPAGSWATMVVSIQSVCGNTASEFRCASGTPATASQRGLPAGTYYLLVQSSAGTGPYDLEVSITPFGTPTAGDVCANAIALAGAGTYTSSLIGRWDDYATSCDWGGMIDVVYSFTLTELSDVTATAQTTSGHTMFVALESVCGSSASELRCASGTPATVARRALAAGTYYVIVQSDAVVGYDLVLTISTAGAALAGDVCSAPIEIAGAGSYAGSLGGMWDDYRASCDWGTTYSDVVYHFRTTDARDALVTVTNGAGADMYVAIQSGCGTGPDVRCVEGWGSASARARGLPAGDYYVLIDGSGAFGYTMDVALTPGTAAEMPTGNDTCAAPWRIGPTGGFYTGSTTAMRSDYGAGCAAGAASQDVVFQMDLAVRSRIVMSMEGSSYDTALYVHSGTCATGAEVGCNDDYFGLQSFLDLTLAAGTYFVFVDGYSSGSSGSYNLDVTITPM